MGKFSHHADCRPVYSYDLGIFCTPTFSTYENKKKKEGKKREEKEEEEKRQKNIHHDHKYF